MLAWLAFLIWHSNIIFVFFSPSLLFFRLLPCSIGDSIVQHFLFRLFASLFVDKSEPQTDEARSNLGGGFDLSGGHTRWGCWRGDEAV